MAKVRLLHGKPLMVGGKVALNDDCCCGGGATGACCVDGACSTKTEAECNALGGIFLAGQPCSPNPCICPDPDAATITLTFAGLEVCFPDPTVFPPEAMLNVSLILLRQSSGVWAGQFIFCRNTDTGEWLRTDAECESGFDQFNWLVEVFCTGSSANIFDIYQGGSGFFQNPSASPPIAANAQNCPDFVGGGGTATISP